MTVDKGDALRKLVLNWGEVPCVSLQNDGYSINLHFCTISAMPILIELDQAVVNIEGALR